MPEISIDMRMHRNTGIGTYLQNLVPRVMAALPDARFNLLGDPDELSGHPWTSDDNATIVECRAPIYSVAEQLAVSRRTPGSTDLLWSPHYNIPLLYRGRLLVTVHDALFLAMPQYAGGSQRRLYVNVMFRALRRKADAILCVSDFTRRELVKLTGKDRGNLFTAHPGVDGSWFDVEKDRNPHLRPYLLFVGLVKPHKNLRALIEAFEEVKDEVPHDLVIVGNREGLITSDETVVIRAATLEDRVLFTGFVEEDLLRQYFAHADALVLPSLYEGFGLPALEAMACGCPVIVSDAASLPEVCGDAALYCDPRDPSDIAEKIQRLAGDAGLRETLRERGRARAELFTWEACAARTVEVIERVLRRVGDRPSAQKDPR